MLHTLRFFSLQKAVLFHNANFFGSCVIHILYTGCAKTKKKIRRQRVNSWYAPCMPNNYGCSRHTLRICNIYHSFTVKMFMRTRLDVPCIRTLPLLLKLHFVFGVRVMAPVVIRRPHCQPSRNKDKII